MCPTQRLSQAKPSIPLRRHSHRKCATAAKGKDAKASQSFDEVAHDDNISRTDRRIASIAIPVRLPPPRPVVRMCYAPVPFLLTIAMI